MPDTDHPMDEDWFAQRFAAEPIDDDGFSDQIMRRLRRRRLVQRAVLATAAAIGGALALYAARFLPPLGPVALPSLREFGHGTDLTGWMYANWALVLAVLAAAASTTFVTLFED